MSREDRLKKLGLDPNATKIEEMQKAVKAAQTPGEKAEAAEMLRVYKQMNMDDRLDIVVDEFPLKYVLHALIQKHGRDQVNEAWNELSEGEA